MLYPANQRSENQAYTSFAAIEASTATPRSAGDEPEAPALVLDRIVERVACLPSTSAWRECKAGLTAELRAYVVGQQRSIANRKNAEWSPSRLEGLLALHLGLLPPGSWAARAAKADEVLRQEHERQRLQSRSGKQPPHWELLSRWAADVPVQLARRRQLAAQLAGLATKEELSGLADGVAEAVVTATMPLEAALVDMRAELASRPTQEEVLQLVRSAGCKRPAERTIPRAPKAASKHRFQ